MKKSFIFLILIGTLLILFGTTSLIINNKFSNKNDEEIVLNDGTVLKTIYYSFDNGKFSIRVPEDFYLMSEDMLKLKYPEEARPDIVYTNEEGTIDVAISITDRKPISIEDYTNAVKKAFEELYGQVDSEVYDKYNQKIGEVKLMTQTGDSKLYNNMMFFKIDGTLRIVTFNCTEELKEDWEVVGDFIMNSLILNE